MINAASALTILSMAAVTYLTRIGGFIALRNRPLSRRAKAVLEAAPGCVLISLIALNFVSPHPADLVALAGGLTITATAEWRPRRRPQPLRLWSCGSAHAVR